MFFVFPEQRQELSSVRISILGIFCIAGAGLVK